LQQSGRPSLAVFPLQKAAASDAYSVQAGLLLASTLASSQSYEESIRAYERVLESEPENTAALFGRGRSQLAIGRPAEALESSQQLLLLRPDDQLAIVLQGSALLDLDRPEEAEAALVGVFERAAAANDPNDAARKCGALGLFYRSQDNHKGAGETFSRCIAEYPLNPQLRQHASDFFLARANNERAIGVWRTAVAATPEDLALRAKLEESVELFDSPQAWRMLAGYQRSQGNLVAAREALEASLERSRTIAPSLQFTLADMLIEEGNYARAAEIADGLEELSYRAMIRGAILLRQNKPAEALEMLDTGLKLYPNNAGARYLAGQAALGAGDKERALAEFREAIRVSETETDAALRLAELHFQKGEYLNARQFANRHIAKRIYSEPDAHVVSARSSIILGDYEAAESTLNALRQNSPNQPTAYLEFAELERRKSGPEAALAVLREGGFDLAQLENEAVLRAVAQDMLSLDQGAAALELVTKAANANPELPTFHDLRGRLLLEAGQTGEAERAFSLALDRDSEFAPSLEARGTLALRAGDFAQARAQYDLAAQADPDNAQYVYLKAQAEYLQSNLQSAAELFGQALELDSAHVGAHNDLAWLMASAGRDLESALNHAAQAARLDPNADTLDTLGFVYLQLGDFKEAVGVFSKALEIRPNSPSIEFRLGRALSESGDQEAAREMLNKALETPNFPESEDARAELAKLQRS
jgi:tetratricopeptide (TPR) repeat protein